MISRGKDYFAGRRAAVDRVLAAFGDRTAKGLELVSTIAYLRRHVPKEEFDDNRKLASRIKALKPKYSELEIEKAIAEVRTFLAEGSTASGGGRSAATPSA